MMKMNYISFSACKTPEIIFLGALKTNVFLESGGFFS